MPEDKLKTRRQRLRRLVSDYEGMTALSKRLGLKKPAYISQLLTDPPVRTLSEKTARKWEKLLKLPGGWFDEDSSDTSSSLPPLNVALLEEAIELVTEGCKRAKLSLPPQKLAQLVALQYSDGLTTGRVDRERLEKIFGLIKG